jgi:hypothetical protein
VRPPLPEIAASAPSTPIMLASKAISRPRHHARNRLSVPGAAALALLSTGILPNLKKPEKISIQVSGVE